jgi:hypothetical protein
VALIAALITLARTDSEESNEDSSDSDKSVDAD